MASAPSGAPKARRTRAHLVAQHYASLGFAVTPAFHEVDPKKGKLACGKHPTVRWKQTEVLAGSIVGPTIEPSEVTNYWLGPKCDRRGADICIHAKPSRLVVVDCDRSWKDVVVADAQGNRGVELQFVDGLEAFLAFMDGEVGTELISVSERGVHFFYLVDSDQAAKIRNRTGWLPGVDIRGGGDSSGGVTVETNGVCPHRRWVRGMPSIQVTEASPTGQVVGLEPYGDIVFDKQGNCTSGLPMKVNGHVEGIRPLPAKLLTALLEASGAVPPTLAGLRNTLRIAKTKRHREGRDAGSGTPSPDSVDARASAVIRPYSFQTRCECGGCPKFEEAAQLLAWVPPEVDYEAWRNVLWSLSDLLDGSQCGENLAAEWSAMSIIEGRRDADQARQIYRSDRRHLDDLLR